MKNLRVITSLSCLLLGILLCGCNDNDQLINEINSSNAQETSENNSNKEQNNNTNDLGYNGFMLNGIVFQQCGITTNNELIYFSEWDNPQFNIICTDPTCKHIPYDEISNNNPECSAAFATNMSFAVFGSSSLLYNNNRIIFECSENTDDYVNYTYSTTIYISDIDGSNRKEIESVSGQIIYNETLIDGEYMYFSMVTDYYTGESEYSGQDSNGIDSYEFSGSAYSLSLCKMNLESFECTTLISVEELESANCFNDFYISGEKLYSLFIDQKNSGKDIKSIIYQIDLNSLEYTEEISLDYYACFCGVINNKIYYNDGIDIYAYDIKSKSCTLIGSSVNEEYAVAQVIGDMIAIRSSSIPITEYNGSENESYTCTYTIFDGNNNVVNKINYSYPIQIIRMLDQKIIYSNIESAGDYYWINYENLGESGERICSIV